MFPEPEQGDKFHIFGVVMGPPNQSVLGGHNIEVANND